MNYKITFFAVLCCIAFLPLSAMGNQQDNAVASPGTDLKILRFRKGKKVSECNYKNGFKHGPCVKFYDNGKKRKELYYKAGKRDGVHSEWNAKGKMTFRAHWKAGRTHGAITEWGKKKKVSFCWNHKCQNQNMMTLFKQCSPEQVTEANLSVCGQLAMFLYHPSDEPFAYFTQAEFKVAQTYHARILTLSTKIKPSAQSKRLMMLSKKALQSLCQKKLGDLSACGEKKQTLSLR